jgi:hypothetical protein
MNICAIYDSASKSHDFETLYLVWSEEHRLIAFVKRV